jgi:1-acyl-sn-glycerol-3-phosphate acyltransferase
MLLADPDKTRLPRAYEYVCLYLGLGFLGLMCLLWLPFAVVLNVVMPVRPGRRVGRWVISAAFNLYLRWLTLLGACRFDVSALDALRDSGPLILVANHPCLLDAPMIIARLPNVACIMKANLLNNIFLGAGARLARYICNDPPVGMIRRAVDDLRQGSHLLIFPEGTRSADGHLRPFKSSAAVIAHRAGVPVQALLVESDSAYLSKGWPLFRRPDMPIHYRVRLGQRFEAPEDARAFTVELEQYFAAALNAARAASAVET